MKFFAFIVMLIAIAVPSYFGIVTSYRYQRDVLNHWELADRSSTIQAKKQHIDKFVESLEEGNRLGNFASFNAIFMQTPTNSFRENMNALYTLRGRLSEIETMSPSSFEYQTAIQQITAQEQGEADGMLEVFHDCYYLANAALLWDWMAGITITIVALISVACIAVMAGEF